MFFSRSMYVHIFHFRITKNVPSLLYISDLYVGNFWEVFAPALMKQLHQLPQNEAVLEWAAFLGVAPSNKKCCKELEKKWEPSFRPLQAKLGKIPKFQEYTAKVRKSQKNGWLKKVLT